MEESDTMRDWWHWIVAMISWPRQSAKAGRLFRAKNKWQHC